MEFKVPFNISFVSFVQNPFNVWVQKPLLTDSIIISDSFNLYLKFLIDISIIGYFFIDKRLADQMYEKLQIVCVKLNWLKSIEEYDDQVALKFIIYVIYFTLTVEGHKELTVSMFIICFGHQDAILGSP